MQTQNNYIYICLHRKFFGGVYVCVSVWVCVYVCVCAYVCVCVGAYVWACVSVCDHTYVDKDIEALSNTSHCCTLTKVIYITSLLCLPIIEEWLWLCARSISWNCKNDWCVILSTLYIVKLFNLLISHYFDTWV